jgi:hypothetical protein
MSKRHVGKHWNEYLRKCAFQFLPTIARTNSEICMFPTHILKPAHSRSSGAPTQLRVGSPSARREPVVSILPFLLYCVAVSMAHLTVGAETLRQAAG